MIPLQVVLAPGRVPLTVETVVVLRASGAGREVNLGKVMVSGTVPVTLDANLPARFDGDGSLVVQVRPGSYTLTFQAVHQGAVAQLVKPQLAEPWPAVEQWAVQGHDATRAVNLSGPPGVDPARTEVPERTMW